MYYATQSQSRQQWQHESLKYLHHWNTVHETLRLVRVTEENILIGGGGGSSCSEYCHSTAPLSRD